jgi:signal transduction histidine kinase
MYPGRAGREAMKRRFKAGHTLSSKGRPSKVLKRKGRKVSKPHPGSFSTDELTRLTRERDEALEQQAATSEVLKVISRSPSDLQPIFSTMLVEAVRICEANFGNIYRWDSDALHLAAAHNTPPAFAEFRRRSPIRSTVTPTGRMVAIRAPVHVADLAADPIYTEHRDPGAVAAVELGGVRTFLSVPMLTDDRLVGAFILCRQEVVRPFNDRQIALVTNFASQAVIAIESVRLLNELRQRTHELDRSVSELQRERNNRLMNLEVMAASIGHEVRQPLGAIAAHGSAALRFLDHTPPNLDEVRLALNEMVRSSHHASGIFDNLRALFGSTNSGYERLDVNELTLSVLRIVREELVEHDIVAEVELAPNLPLITGHKGQLQEVLINLVRNAVEAMSAVRDGHRILQVGTDCHDNKAIVISVRDSGPGIDPLVLDRLFEVFVTTKSDGMGLGLALCRMIVERHKGELTTSSAEPRGSVFRVALPIEKADF